MDRPPPCPTRSRSVEELEFSFAKELSFTEPEIDVSDDADRPNDGIDKSRWKLEDVMDEYIGSVSRNQDYEISQPKSRPKMLTKRRQARLKYHSSKSNATTSASDSELVNKATGATKMPMRASEWSHSPKFLFREMPAWELFGIFGEIVSLWHVRITIYIKIVYILNTEHVYVSW